MVGRREEVAVGMLPAVDCLLEEGFLCAPFGWVGGWVSEREKKTVSGWVGG